MPETNLPTHPRTGLRAVGWSRRGPIWPILGGSSPEPTDSPAAPPAAPPPAPADVTSEPAKPAEDPMDTDAGRRALAAERQKAADEKRRADDLDTRLRAIEDKDKTELERASARVAELEKSYAEEQKQRLRLQVATTHRIPADDLILLTGTTEAELNAQAERIAALNTASAAAAAPPTFAPSTAQQAGNGTPVAPKGGVDAGRSMFRDRHPAKQGS